MKGSLGCTHNRAALSVKVRTASGRSVIKMSAVCVRIARPSQPQSSKRSFAYGVSSTFARQLDHVAPTVTDRPEAAGARAVTIASTKRFVYHAGPCLRITPFQPIPSSDFMPRRPKPSTAERTRVSRKTPLKESCSVASVYGFCSMNTRSL